MTKLDSAEGGRPMFIWALADGYDAARILLTEWLQDFAEAVPGRLVLGVPHRNWLVAVGDADEELLKVVAAAGGPRAPSRRVPREPVPVHL